MSFDFWVGFIAGPLVIAAIYYVLLPLGYWYLLAIGYNIFIWKYSNDPWGAIKRNPWKIYWLMAFKWPIKALEYSSVTSVEIRGIRWTPFFKYEDLRSK